VRISLSIIFWLIISASSIYGQQFKLIRGKVSNDDFSLSGIHVVNTSRVNAVITDSEGFFEISVKIGERLRFSGVQYKTKDLLIGDAIFDSKFVTVYLEPFVNELEEVIVKPNSLSGNLSSDLANANIPKIINFDDLGIPGYKGKREEKIPSIQQMGLNLALVQVDVEAVYKYVSGYYRKLKLIRKQDKEFKTMLKIIQFYGLYFFSENYNLEPQEVYDFVLGCKENTSLLLIFNQNRHDEVVNIFSEYYTTYSQLDVSD
tara:strand:+ start:69 stop:848 length:780 start_codon:yes stop_codon:yes gene_type:complete